MTLLGDEPASWPVTEVETVFSGAMLGLRRDTIENDGEVFQREIVTHPGAVAIVALDADERVLVLRQYRHAVQRLMVEIPAGLLDVDGEPPLEAAKRELREEGLIEADRWTPLFELRTSPGASTEVVHMFLAQGLHAVELPAGFTPRHEEASMTRAWVALSDVVDAVLAGRVSNSLTVGRDHLQWIAFATENIGLVSQHPPNSLYGVSSDCRDGVSFEHTMTWCPSGDE